MCTDGNAPAVRDQNCGEKKNKIKTSRKKQDRDALPINKNLMQTHVM